MENKTAKVCPGLGSSTGSSSYFEFSSKPVAMPLIRSKNNSEDVGASSNKEKTCKSLFLRRKTSAPHITAPPIPSGEKVNNGHFERKQGKSFVGKSSADQFQIARWLQSEKFNIKKCMEKIVCDEHNLSNNMNQPEFSSLPKGNTFKPGDIDSGIITYVKSPSEFFMVLENKSNFSLMNHSEWDKFFPSVQTGPQALCGLHALLNVTYQILEYFKEANFRPKNGILVAVKIVKKLNTSTAKSTVKDKTVYQIRRGVIINCKIRLGKEDDCIYEVYLLDYGFVVEVSEYFLMPLFHPFSIIPPLAIKCGLFGVSPVGEYWNEFSTLNFLSTISENKDALFHVECLSGTAFAPENECNDIDVATYLNAFPTAVNLELAKFQLPSCLYQHTLNATLSLTSRNLGIPWNFFPAQPKLMEGTKILEHKNAPQHILEPGRFTVSLRDATLLTPFLPRLYQRFSPEILNREMQKLFQLRSSNITDIREQNNRLLMFISDPKEILQKPTRIIPV